MSDFAAVLLEDGRVLVSGGGEAKSYGRVPSYSHTDIYDPTTGEWSQAGEMSKNRARMHTATVLEDGTVLIVGGSRITQDIYGGITDREGMTSIEVYDPAVGWETK